MFISGPYRFFFFSREERRMHVHVTCADGEVKYWLEPAVVLAKSVGLNERVLAQIETILKEHKDEIRTAWQRHFEC